MARDGTERSGGSGVLHIGCAGWSLPREHAGRFPAGGTHLSRYSACYPAVEINSSFYRPHRPSTYARWAESVPEGFRFAVKAPKVITHERRLVDAGEPLEGFLEEATQLGAKLGPLLVQLPPSLRFSAESAKEFFAELRSRFDGDVALEPRHATWFEPAAERLIARYRVARVAADPAVVPAAGEPGGWDGLVYYRMHGAPKVYYSTYSDDDLERLADSLKAAARSAVVWCIFDNTAEGAAIVNALDLLGRIAETS
ncbi:DUF72 domain-containing protein [Paludisphaera mucosa]|uniref:DUF72 domain-containing protein n=1 Tax=Paludisphaera mucosa TaxID=3030827 RepID=A0ABT6FEM9_9BACT|nr:DUF72 domain-containing protein [Paludisphaera mucosa]MDG3005987.1 DUF72 domain-containing protein [Paludisphaera mucosa]